MILKIGFEILATLIETLCTFWLINLKYELNIKTAMYGLFLSIPISICIVVINLITPFTNFTILIFVLYVMIVSFLYINRDILENFFLLIISIILITTNDFTIAALLGTLLKNNNYLSDVISVSSDFRIYYIFIDKSCLIITTILFKFLLNKYIKRKYALLISIGVFTIILSWITFKHSNLIVLLGWVLYISFFLMNIIILIYYNRWKKAEELEALLKVQNNIYKTEYNTFKQYNEQIAKLSHDLQYFSLHILYLLEKKEYEESIAYIKNKKKLLVSSNNITYSGNEYIDYIINHKKNEAENNNIKVTVDVDVIGACHTLKQEDLSVILGNLLDNAIEASLNCEINNRRLIIKINKIHNILIITIKNNYEKAPNLIKNHLITNKLNKQIHGLGLKSVKERIDKYDGVFQYSFEDNIFTTELMIFI